MSEIAKIFKGLPKRFNKANVKDERTYYFSLGDEEKWTVHIKKDECTVKEGKADSVNGVDIAVDPSTDSLDDVLARINGLGAGATAIFDSAADKVRILSDSAEQTLALSDGTDRKSVV